MDVEGVPVVREGGSGGGEKLWGKAGEEEEGEDEGAVPPPWGVEMLAGFCEEGVPAFWGVPALASPPGR